jgi:CheY-like chemotaxis protein
MPSVEGCRVLIVDDERIVSDTLTHIFRSHGYEVRSAVSAEQAIELLSEWVPEVAILDVSLPKMNGVELAILLATQCPQCRLLLFSGRPESEQLVNDAANGGKFFEIVAKPVHPSVLLDWAAQKPIH